MGKLINRNAKYSGRAYTYKEVGEETPRRHYIKCNKPFYIKESEEKESYLSFRNDLCNDLLNFANGNFKIYLKYAENEDDFELENEIFCKVDDYGDITRADAKKNPNPRLYTEDNLEGLKLSKVGRHVETIDCGPYSNRDIDVDYKDYFGTFSYNRCLVELLWNVEGLNGIVGLVDRLYDMKPNEQNYKTTNEEVKKVEKFLKEALEIECTEMIKRYQAKEISEKAFTKYVDRYNEAKENMLPKMASNWESKKEEREKFAVDFEIKEARKQAREVLKSKVKAKLAEVKEIPAKLKALHAQKKEERKQYKERMAKIKEENENLRRQKVVDELNETR